LSLSLFSALLGGCVGADDTGPGDTAFVVDPAAPVMASAAVTCFEHLTGDTFTQWSGAATVSDPQGLSTIEVIGRVAISDARGDLGEAPLTCADGACTTSWRDKAYDLECDSVAATTYDFAFQAVDIDGNWSAPLVVSGERLEAE
jgi:hypothetical protein